MKDTTQKNLKNRRETEKFICPENQKSKTEEKLSPSGRYRLLIRWYATKEGCWNYSRGTVYRVSDDEMVCDIVRNYSIFHHSFVTKDDHEYLITGRSYMSQTIVDLDAGIEHEPQEYHYDGLGFCWARAFLSPDGQTLLVDGCHWAAPYEFRFYDFRDPSKGWPEIPVITSVEEYEKHKDHLSEATQTALYADEKDPTFNEDGTITVYESASIFKPTGQREDDISMEQLNEIGETYDDESNWDREVDLKLTLERRGDVLVVLDTWKSDYRQEQDRRRQEYKKKQDEDFRRWRDTDLTWALLKELLEKDPDLELKGLGWIGSSGKDREEGEKNFWFFRPRIASRHPQETFKYDEDNDQEDPGPRKTAALKWGTVAGDTIETELWIYGKGHSTETFPKTEGGLKAALNTIRGHFA